MTKLAFIFTLLIVPLAPLDAQVDYSDMITSGEFNSYYKRGVRERRFVPYAPTREADMKYTKRVIRCIDARQKTNKIIEWPRSSFISHLLTALEEGSIVPYKNDSLASFYNSVQLKNRLCYEILIPVSIDPTDPTITIDSTVMECTEGDEIHKFFVLEEWNFNSETSVFTPRILAIAPIFSPKLSGSVIAQEQPLCWIMYSDEVRQTFARWELFNRSNDVRLNYDDWFQMRLFDSYIVFSNNVFDLYINEFEENKDNGVKCLLAAEEVKNDLFVFEHDLWQY